ncbi:MAG: hypothetical protein H6742_16595 [Alphaproteobacteria bacterium]|nr:hypothetical protein [Alphaproteobacteria bacterium]
MSDPSRERQELIEAAVTAWRPTAPDGRILDHHAWRDLDAAGRIEAFDETLRAREVEAALDPQGLSGTARAVLGRLRRG